MPLIHNQTSLPLEPGKSLFDYADDLAVRVPTSCGRTGECHECIVEVRRGMEALDPPTKSEKFLRENYRLACQATVVDIEADIEFNILRRQPRILTESIATDNIELDPLTVREHDQIIFKGPEGPCVIDRYRGRILGIAADIGTTTVAMNLVDLETGDIIYTASFENPQRFGGSDVMHRISYETGNYRGELQAVLISSINYEIGEMVRALKIRRRQIVELVAVGNTTMRDILFGIDVEPIGQKPYKSHIETDFNDGNRETTALNVPAHELGIRTNPNANVYSGPLIASHIGSDVAADLLTIAIDEQDETVMLIDIGTNTEIIAGNRHQLHAASCPAGPAFEGGNVTYAMPGYDGAVERVVIPSLSERRGRDQPKRSSQGMHEEERTGRHSSESRNPDGMGRVSPARGGNAEGKGGLQFQQADMRRLPNEFSGKFDAVINMFSSFGYLETESDDQQVLHQIARCLKPGGKLLMDLLNREWVIINNEETDWHRHDDGRIVLERRQLDLQTSTNHLTYTEILPDGSRNEMSDLHMRLYSLTELTKMLAVAGLNLEYVHGGFRGEAYSVDTRRMIIVAAKREA